MATARARTPTQCAILYSIIFANLATSGSTKTWVTCAKAQSGGHMEPSGPSKLIYGSCTYIYMHVHMYVNTGLNNDLCNI